MKTTSILLAIPDDWVLDECRNSLENGDGCQIETARDGLECWTRMREIAPDVLIMDEDLLWGGADGVAARLLEDSRRNNVSVLVMADRIGPHGARDNLRQMGVRFLYRPFQVRDLLTAVSAVRQLN